MALTGRRKGDGDRGGLRRYAVFVHAKDLMLTDDAGQRQLGGAYTWRYVTAENEIAAAALAIESLRTTPAFIDEVKDIDEAIAHASAEKVLLLERDEKRRGTGVVFYIDTNEVS